MPNKRSYCFTYWKMPELIDKYMDKMSKLKKFRYLVAQIEEAPITKNKHIQGYVEFSDRVSTKGIKEIMPGIHLESRKGTREQARDYCMKKDTQVTEPITVGSWETGGRGKRNDLSFIKDQIKVGKRLKSVIMDDCNNYQQIRMAEKISQYSSKPRDPKKPPEIRWYWGATGTGKTKSVYDEFSSEDIYPSFAYKWWDGYAQQKVILIDDMRRDYCKFHILLKLLDRYPLLAEIKGGTTHINSPIIIITSAYSPKNLFRTREDLGQLMRRITKITFFEKDCQRQVGDVNERHKRGSRESVSVVVDPERWCESDDDTSMIFPLSSLSPSVPDSEGDIEDIII